MAQHTESGHSQPHHHILPEKTAVLTFVTLIVLTLITVVVAHVDLGPFNFPVAMAVATAKALLVVMIFMGLKYDRRENSVIFFTSFLFLAIFIVLTSSDIFFRGDIYWGMAKGNPPFPPIEGGGAQKSKLAHGWISTPELVSHGRELFSQQCVACHGPNGEGNGPAAAGLNPHPRNFHQNEGWKNGRKATMVFKTLKEGIPGSGMSSFATLPVDDRWALAHYVLSLGPQPVPQDAPGDFAKAGIDPNKAGGGAGEETSRTVPVEFMIERMAEDAKH
jgi:caa(3)-type oxidase subunit IV